MAEYFLKFYFNGDGTVTISERDLEIMLNGLRKNNEVIVQPAVKTDVARESCGSSAAVSGELEAIHSRTGGGGLAQSEEK